MRLVVETSGGFRVAFYGMITASDSANRTIIPAALDTLLRIAIIDVPIKGDCWRNPNGTPNHQLG
jgi:hypothetical protein